MSRSERLEAAATRAIDAQHRALTMRDSGKFSWVADDPDCPDIMRLAALTEELGEVARALHDGNNGALDVELSHLAGVALAWNAAIHA